MAVVLANLLHSRMYTLHLLLDLPYHRDCSYAVVE